MRQTGNVRTARGTFAVRTANPKRFELLASRYLSNSRYLHFFKIQITITTNAECIVAYSSQLAGARARAAMHFSLRRPLNVI
eukprot:COSAG01_NODE_28089_length_669_cov_1.407018_1_plen_82_part_00